MRIKNLRPNSCFFPYGGSSRRGVHLNEGEAGPEMPPEKINIPQLRADLDKGRIALVLTPADRKTLSGQIDDKHISGASEEPVEKKKAGTEDAQKAATKKKKAEAAAKKKIATKKKTPRIVKKKGKTPTAAPVNPIATELISRLGILTPKAREEEINKLSESDDAGIKAALPKIKQAFQKEEKV